MSGRATLRSLVISAAIALVAVPARADDTNKVAAATLLFDEGVRALDAGRLDEACQKLAKSQELAPSGGTLLALAECHERAGRVASAWIAYRGAAARAAAAGKADAEASALEHAGKLEPKLARLTIKTPTGTPTNFELLRDTTVVSTSELGVAVPVDPGKHEIHASAPGMKPWVKQIQVPASASVTIEVPPLEADASAPPPTTSDGSTQRILGITAAGLGAGAMIGGTIFGVLAMSANSDGESECVGKECRSQGAIDSINKASDQATVSTILFIAGAALVAGGAALYFTAPKPRQGSYLDWSTATYRW